MAFQNGIYLWLANAKIMYEKAEKQSLSSPLFQSVADTLAAEMARMDVEELARQLGEEAFPHFVREQ